MNIIVLLLVLIVLGGVGPWWPHSQAWGYGPVGGLGGILVLLLVLRLLGVI